MMRAVGSIATVVGLTVGAMLLTVGMRGASAEPLGTAFTYQGHLKVDGSPQTASYDFEFRLFDAAVSGVQVGATLPRNAVDVRGGVFTVGLDFGGPAFAGERRWLEMAVRPAGSGAFTVLPRQELTAVPAALSAVNANQLGGLAPGGYVAKAGDTMTGTLNLPENGLVVGTDQLVAAGGKVRIGPADEGGEVFAVTQSTTGDVMRIYRHGVDATSALLHLWHAPGADNATDRAGMLIGFQVADRSGGAGAAMIEGGKEGDYTHITKMDGFLAFRTAADSTLNEHLRITSAGNVGIGTASPEGRLTILDTSSTDSSPLLIRNRNANPMLRVYQPPTGQLNNALYLTDGSGGGGWKLGTAGDESYSIGKFSVGTGTASRKFFVSGDAGGTTGWYNDSDERLKKDIRTIDGALQKVQQLRGVTFEWRDPSTHVEGRQIGFVAQEAMVAVPEVVQKKGDYYSMAPAELTAVLVEAIKEQQQQIEALKAEVAALKATR